MTSPNTFGLLQETLLIEKTNSTKKNRKNDISDIEKKKMWDLFEENVPNKKKSLKDRMECIYTTNDKRENCEICINKLIINEDGFLCCTNKKCGMIYKDVLDTGAEWRYYGADDSQSI